MGATKRLVSMVLLVAFLTISAQYQIIYFQQSKVMVEF